MSAPRVPERICWDEHGGLYLPPEYAYIGAARCKATHPFPAVPFARRMHKKRAA